MNKKIASLLAAMSVAIVSFGQGFDSFRVGRLDNGLTYYLCHNENPSGCADFYIAHNVGALQEEDNQNGLAHFLEHMAFNGTRHYPGKRIIEFLGDEGVRFGYNINAYTSRSETVYNINNVPLLRESFVDSVLMILHDWSCDISCEQEALDEERGVISEEWRLRDEPRYRMFCRQNELIYKGGKQPLRTVIGSYEVINSFRREEILDFYDKWYRPDLQAIVVVGDFDVDAMEAKVKSMFSDITMPSNPPQKQLSYTPAPQEGPMFADQTDPTIKYKVYKIIYKMPYPSFDERAGEEFLKDYFSRVALSSVLGDRLKEKSRQKDCPYSSAVCVTNSYEPDYYITMFTISPRNDADMSASVKPVIREINRMVKYGISEDELEIARLNLSKMDHIDRDLYPEDIKHADMVKMCTENFLRGFALVDPIRYKEMQREAIASITLESLKPYYASIFVNDQVIYSNCHNINDTTGLVSEEAMRGILSDVASEDLQPDYLKFPALDLTIDVPAGSIKSVRREKAHGIETWKLSNGVTVYYRKSREVNSSDHLSMEAVFNTGYSVYDRDGVARGKAVSAYIKRNAGFRGVERLSMKNYPQLSGVNVVINSKPEYSGFSFSAKPSMIENAFKSLYLQIADPYLGSERTLAKYRADNLKSLGRKKNSRDLYREKAEDAYFGDNFWNSRVDSAAFEALDMDMVKEQYVKEFCDIRSMKVYICSDADRSQIENYVCRYIASLPAGVEVPRIENTLWQGYKGNVVYTETNAPLSAPMCDIDCKFSCTLDKDTRARVAINMLDYILSMRYLNLIREERGGAYHVGFSTNIYDEPEHGIESTVAFQTRPELKDILLGDVTDVLSKMASEGPSDDEMNMAKRYYVKRYGELSKRKANSVQAKMNEMKLYMSYGIDYGYDCEKVLSRIDASYMKKLSSRIAAGDRYTAVLVEQ